MTTAAALYPQTDLLEKSNLNAAAICSLKANVLNRAAKAVNIKFVENNS